MINYKAVQRNKQNDLVLNRHIKMFLLAVFTAFCFVTVFICALVVVINYLRS